MLFSTGSRCCDDVVLAADHQAVAALEAVHAAAGADVDVVDALVLQLSGSVDVVAVVGVSAVDDDVAFLHQLGDLHDHLAGDAGRHHDPGDPRLVQRLDEVLERGRADRALTGQLRHRVRARVERDGCVPVAHDAPDDVGAHAPEADHAELHLRSPYERCDYSTFRAAR